MTKRGWCANPVKIGVAHRCSAARQGRYSKPKGPSLPRMSTILTPSSLPSKATKSPLRNRTVDWSSGFVRRTAVFESSVQVVVMLSYKYKYKSCFDLNLKNLRGEGVRLVQKLYKNRERE